MNPFDFHEFKLLSPTLWRRIQGDIEFIDKLRKQGVFDEIAKVNTPENRRLIAQTIAEYYKIYSRWNPPPTSREESPQRLKAPPAPRSPQVDADSVAQSDTTRYAELQNLKIVQLKKRIKHLQTSIPDLRQFADQCRMKNGKINYSKLSRMLGLSNKTAKQRCEREGIR